MTNLKLRLLYINFKFFQATMKLHCDGIFGLAYDQRNFMEWQILNMTHMHYLPVFFWKALDQTMAFLPSRKIY